MSYHVTVESKLECLSLFPHEGEARAGVILGGNVDGNDCVLCNVIAISLGDVCVTVHPVFVKKKSYPSPALLVESCFSLLDFEFSANGKVPQTIKSRNLLFIDRFENVLDILHLK